MKTCIKCENPISGPGVFRIRIGGVTYTKDYQLCFIQTPIDCFQDHTKTKWLCPACAAEIGLFIEELRWGECRAPEGDSTTCNRNFEPDESEHSESVLLIEWGRIGMAKGGKGPTYQFLTEDNDKFKGIIHFNCACDGYNLPLHNLPLRDEP